MHGTALQRPVKRILRTLTLGLCLAGLLAPLTGMAKESIPPRPERCFTDSGKINRANLLNEKLGRFADGSSWPIVVAAWHPHPKSQIPESAANVILIIAGVTALGTAALWFLGRGSHKDYPKYVDRLLNKIMFFEITSSRRRKRSGSRKGKANAPPFQDGADAEW